MASHLVHVKKEPKPVRLPHWLSWSLASTVSVEVRNNMSEHGFRDSPGPCIFLHSPSRCTKPTQHQQGPPVRLVLNWIHPLLQSLVCAKRDQYWPPPTQCAQPTGRISELLIYDDANPCNCSARVMGNVNLSRYQCKLLSFSALWLKRRHHKRYLVRKKLLPCKKKEKELYM